MPDDSRRGSLPVLCLTVFVDLVGFSIIFPLFPDMLDHYLAAEGDQSLVGGLNSWLKSLAGTDTPEKQKLYATVFFGGLLGSLYSALQFVCAPIWGRLSDRIGRRPVLLLTIAGLCGSYLLWAFAGTFLLLVFSRLLGGLMSGNISVATAAVADMTGKKDRAKGMGMIGAAFGLGFIVGPAIGSILAQPIFDLNDAGLPGLNPYSAAALAAAGLSAWNLVWVIWRLPETLPPDRRGQGEPHTRSANPLRLLGQVDIPGVTRTNMVYFIFLAAFAGMEFTLTFLAKDIHGYDRTNTFWIFVYVGLIIVAVQGGLVRRLAPRFGEQRLVLTGLVLLLPGLLITGTTTNEVLFYVGLGLLSVGSALATPCLTALVSLYTPPERQGEILGTFRSLGALSRAIAPLVAGLAYWKFGPASPYAGAAALMLVPLWLAVKLPATTVQSEVDSRQPE